MCLHKNFKKYVINEMFMCIMNIDFVAILVLKQCILYFLIQYFLEGSLWRYYIKGKLLKDLEREIQKDIRTQCRF
jgi:hypothetical protein